MITTITIPFIKKETVSTEDPRLSEIIQSVGDKAKFISLVV